MFEQFDHTADLGLRIIAPDLNSLFAAAGRAFFSVIVSDLETIEPRDSLTIVVGGIELDYLLLDWLNEVLYSFESKRFLAREFEVAVDSAGLSATLRGDTYDPARHVLAHEVKAITYHGLKVEQTATGWLAEVILDI